MKSLGISATRLRAAMAAQQLSGVELAQRAGMRPPHLSRLLAGQATDVRVSRARRLAKAVGLRIEDLLE